MVGIHTNITALFAKASLSASAQRSATSIARLSSGHRISRAADDVAGLSVGTILKSTVNTLKTALNNTQQGSTLLAVADGALHNIQTILQRQKALSVQATSGTLSASERGFLDQEFQNLSAEIDRLVENTRFNHITLLNGDLYNDAILKTDTNTIRPATFAQLVYGIASNTRFGGVTAELREGVTSSEVDSIIDPITPSAPLTSGWQTASVADNPDFVGDLGGARLEVTYVATNQVVLSLTVGDYRYVGRVTNTNVGSATTFQGYDVETGQAGGGLFRLNLNALAVANAQDAQTYASRLNSTLDKINFFQTRTLELDASGALGGSSAVIRWDDFDEIRIDDIRVTAAYGTSAAGPETGLIEFIINGESYTHTISASGQFAPGANIILRKNGDATSAKRIHLDWALGSFVSNGHLNNVDNAAKFEEVLKQSFRLGKGDSAVLFQTGNQTQDAISVGIRAVSTQHLGTDTLHIRSLSEAQQASAQLDNAIAMVTSVRADVGALQSRFDYAATNLTTTILNTDAAKSVFWDTDMAEESTDYATSQVSIQASVSVLAQANRLPQNLLKLIES